MRDIKCCLLLSVLIYSIGQKYPGNPQHHAACRISQMPSISFLFLNGKHAKMYFAHVISNQLDRNRYLGNLTPQSCGISLSQIPSDHQIPFPIHFLSIALPCLIHPFHTLLHIAPQGIANLGNGLITPLSMLVLTLKLLYVFFCISINLPEHETESTIDTAGSVEQ